MTRAWAVATVVAGCVVAASSRASAQEIVDHAGPTRVVIAHESRIVLVVEDADRARQRIVTVIAGSGAQLVRGEDREISLDVPNARYRDLVAALAHVGDLQSEQVLTEDLTSSIATTASAARAADTRRTRLEGIKKVARDVPEQLLLEHQIEAVTSDLATADASLRTLARRGAMTRVDIRLQAPAVEPIGETKLPFPWLDQLGLARLDDTTTPVQPPTPVLRSFIDGSFRFQGTHLVRGGKLDGAANALDAAMSLRALGEADPVGLFGGFDLALGGGSGFLYGVQALGGAGMPIGRRFAFGVATGPGIDGLTSVVPFGVDVPIELYMRLDWFEWMGVALSARDGWVLASKDRRHGSRAAPFGDEAGAGITLLFGTREDYDYSSERTGLHVGFFYRQAMGTSVYELGVGFGAADSDLSTSY